jgi:NAD(P)H-dependent flavin oxidoreductase YrpB (nitropropane dioxygenase family)
MSDLRALLGIRHPVVLAPFGGISSVELTAAVSSAGGLGSYGLYGYDGDRIRQTAAALRAATAAPFALNIWLPTGDEVAPGDVLGAVGSTGNSTGPHLHFEVRNNGSSIEPVAYLKTLGIDPSLYQTRDRS